MAIHWKVLLEKIGWMSATCVRRIEWNHSPWQQMNFRKMIIDIFFSKSQPMKTALSSMDWIVFGTKGVAFIAYIFTKGAIGIPLKYSSTSVAIITTSTTKYVGSSISGISKCLREDAQLYTTQYFSCIHCNQCHNKYESVLLLWTVMDQSCIRSTLFIEKRQQNVTVIEAVAPSSPLTSWYWKNW